MPGRPGFIGWCARAAGVYRRSVPGRPRKKYGKNYGSGHMFCHSFRGNELISVVKSMAQAILFAILLGSDEDCSRSAEGLVIEDFENAFLNTFRNAFENVISGKNGSKYVFEYVC